MTNQNYADAIALLLLVAAGSLGYLGYAWAWTIPIAALGTFSFAILKRGAGAQILNIDRIGLAPMFVLQVANAAGIFALGRLACWLIS